MFPPRTSLLAPIASERADPVAALLACHAQIRLFSALAVKVARLPDAPPEQIADAAMRLHRYFALALPLHVADEEVSLEPELEVVGPPALIALLDTLTAQHAEIESLLSRLLPAWRHAVETPAQGYEAIAAVAPVAEALDRLFATHLALEEQEVLPHVAALLPPDVLERIFREMRARRTLGS
jgi:hemerythrin-like domain-containing protein